MIDNQNKMFMIYYEWHLWKTVIVIFIYKLYFNLYFIIILSAFLEHLIV